MLDYPLLRSTQSLAQIRVNINLNPLAFPINAGVSYLRLPLENIASNPHGVRQRRFGQRGIGERQHSVGNPM